MTPRRQANPSVKAKQSRIYRTNQRVQKRFEAPLREFIEVKYKEIFEEYVELYNRMDAENPKKIDLKKTEIFKQWKRLNQHFHSDILTTAIRETIGQDHNKAAETEAAETEAAENDQTESVESDQSETESVESDQSETESVESEATESEAAEPQVPENEVNQGLLAAQQVDDLVNQMILDDELRALLNTEPEDDEGIELNIDDEIDIQPFDFNLE